MRESTKKTYKNIRKSKKKRNNAPSWVDLLRICALDWSGMIERIRKCVSSCMEVVDGYASPGLVAGVRQCVLS